MTELNESKLPKQAIRSFDKIALLRRRGVSVQTIGQEIYFNCPFCDDGRSRFYLNDVSGKAYCHNCGWATRRFENFVASFLGRTISESMTMVLEATGHRSRHPEQEKEKHAIDLPDGFKLLEQPAPPPQKIFWKYLEGRDLTPGRVLEYDIGCVRTGVYKMRVVVPVYWDEELVSWVARDITGKASRKILTPMHNQQSDYLLNMDRLWGRDHLVLVEGPFDMLRIPDLAVASFGKHLSQRQLALLIKSGVRRVTLAYDEDAWLIDPGRRSSAISATYRALADHMDVHFVEFEPGEDPGSTKETRLRVMLQQSTQLTQAYITRKMKRRTAA